MSIFLIVATTTLMNFVEIGAYREPSLEACAAHSAQAAKTLGSTSGVYAYCLDYTGKLVDGWTTLRVVAWVNSDGLVNAVQARHPSLETCQTASELMLKNKTVYVPPGANAPSGSTTAVSGPMSYSCFQMGAN